MSTRPAAPDPQRDRHVAFPEHAPAPTLPPTAWAPHPGTRVLPPPSVRAPSRRRRGVGWWVVAAFFGLPMLGSGMWAGGGAHDGMMGGSGMPVEQQAPAQPWQDGSSTIVVKDLPGEAVSGVQPDQQTFAVPAGTTTYRVEVAGGDPRGTLQVVATHGDASVPETAMPFAVEVHTDEPDTLQWVVAHGSYGQAEIQCRVYVAEDLVAINTGQGMTECALPPA